MGINIAPEKIIISERDEDEVVQEHTVVDETLSPEEQKAEEDILRNEKAEEEEAQ